MKKHKIYSKIKQPYIVMEEKPQNTAQIISSMFNINNVWSDFIDKVMMRGQMPEVKYEDNLKIILENTSDKGLSREIMSELMKMEDYNPFVQSIPTDKMSQKCGNYIKNLQKKLILRKMWALYVFKNACYKLNYLGRSYTCVFIKKHKENINKELFMIGVDIIFICNDGGYIISSNPESSNRPDFTALYRALDKREKGVWYLHGSKGLLSTQRDRVSNLSLRGLIYGFTHIKRIETSNSPAKNENKKSKQKE